MNFVVKGTSLSSRVYKISQVLSHLTHIKAVFYHIWKKWHEGVVQITDGRNSVSAIFPEKTPTKSIHRIKFKATTAVGIFRPQLVRTKYHIYEKSFNLNQPFWFTASFKFFFLTRNVMIQKIVPMVVQIFVNAIKNNVIMNKEIIDKTKRGKITIFEVYVTC